MKCSTAVRCRSTCSRHVLTNGLCSRKANEVTARAENSAEICWNADFRGLSGSVIPEIEKALAAVAAASQFPAAPCHATTLETARLRQACGRQSDCSHRRTSARRRELGGFVSAEAPLAARTSKAERAHPKRSSAGCTVANQFANLDVPAKYHATVKRSGRLPRSTYSPPPSD